MEPRWCTRCGQPLYRDARFCTRCGTGVAPAVRGGADGFFRPRRRSRDSVALAVWAMLAALALGTTLGSLAIPAPGHTVATQTLVSWLVRVVIVLIAAGVLGGVFVRADGRYRELAMGAFALGWIIVFLMFGFWATMHTAPSDCTAANPCDTPAETFGTGVIALLAAVILVLSALAGRCGRRLVVPKLPKPT